MSEKKPVYGTSTIAMSCNNLLAVLKRPLDLQFIHMELKRLQHPGLDVKQVKEALTELHRRGMLRQVEPYGFMLTDPLCRLIVRRSIDDVMVEDDGSVSGGWTGWMRLEEGGKLSLIEGHANEREIT